MKKIVTAIILIALMTITLAGCKDNTPPSVVKPDPWYTEGFTKGSSSDNDMFNDFIECAFNTAELASISKITNNNKQLSLFLNFNITINATSLIATVKINYNDALKTCDSGIEVFNGTQKIFALYTREFISTNQSELYFDFNNSKIKILSDKLLFANSFPLQINEEFKNYLLYIFNTLLKVKNIKYEYKNISGKFTRHYNFEIDFGESLRKIYNIIKFTDLEIGGFSMTFKEFLNLTKGAFGLSEQDILDNNIATNSLYLDFYTVDGKEQSIGFGYINKVKINVDIAESEKNNLFSGKKTALQIEINTISIKPILINVLPIKEELDKFVVYSSKNFVFEGSLIYMDKSYDLNLDFVYDKEVPTNTNIDITIKDNQSIIYHLNYKNNLITIMFKDKTVSYKFDIDKFFLDFEEKLSSMTVVRMLDIIFAKLRIDGSNIIFSIDTDLLNKITPIIDGDIFFQQYSTDNVVDAYKELGFDLNKFLTEGLYISLDLDTAFLKTKD